MAEFISGYRLLTPMHTAGSGSARWCFASRGLERFFLKEFLTPVWPAQENTPLGQRQCDRCEAFEAQRQRLYTAISCVIGDTLVPVVDFFQYERRYYAVSEALDHVDQTAETITGLSDEEKRAILYEVALCLQRLHMQGVVHTDLRPDHILLQQRPDGWKPRLIDLDSGFLESEPPQHSREMEGDPVYLSPEAFLCMDGQRAELTHRLDTFAFGAIIHRIWTGSLPMFDQTKYQYLYEASLDGGEIQLSDDLPEAFRPVIVRMLSVNASDRPSDAEVTALFDVPCPQTRSSKPVNGLMRLMRT